MIFAMDLSTMFGSRGPLSGIGITSYVLYIMLSSRALHKVQAYETKPVLEEKYIDNTMQLFCCCFVVGIGVFSFNCDYMISPLTVSLVFHYVRCAIYQR